MTEGALKRGAVLDGTYRLTRPIARGGCATVWHAIHARLPSRQVAVKVLLQECAGDALHVARLRAEAEVTARVEHPNVVQVLDWNTLPCGAPYVVLEYLEGEDLRRRLERGALPLEDALDVARQVGAALAAAHRVGVVHRDLKPDNVFLCPTDSGGVLRHHVKLLDFGLAAAGRTSTAALPDPQVVGTPRYMAPEQAEGCTEKIDARSDVYALGALVYEMLCGAPVCDGEGVGRLTFQVRFEEPPPLSDRVASLPPHVADAVHRALAKAPDDRFPDVATFIEALSGSPLSFLERRRDDLEASLAALCALVPSRVGDQVERLGSRLRGRWVIAAAVAALLGCGVVAAVHAHERNSAALATREPPPHPRSAHD